MKTKITFPNLNALRFIAAILVIVHHVEQLKNIFHLNNLYKVPFVHEVGKLGVVLFFTLSGFLITYLLLLERNDCGKVQLRNFYIRRILRIFPLYYLIIFLSFFIFPLLKIFDLPPYTISFENYPVDALLSYVFMIPNIASSYFDVIPYASQAWSIGTEEQFYLLWPLIFVFFIGKELKMMLGIIFIYILVLLLLSYSDFKNLLTFWQMFNIDCMAIGGIFAYLEFNKSVLSSYIKQKSLFIFTSITSILLIMYGVNFGLFNYEIYSLLFAIIIINLACNPSFSNLLEVNVFNFLGKISYGLYMYHPICIVLCIKVLTYIGVLNYLTLYSTVLSSTIIISYLSYNYWEKPFLLMKNKF